MFVVSHFEDLLECTQHKIQMTRQCNTCRCRRRYRKCQLNRVKQGLGMLKWWQIWPTYAHFSSTTGWRSASEILTTALLFPRLVEFIRIPSVLSTFCYTRSSPNPCEQGLWSCRATKSNECSSAVTSEPLYTWEGSAEISDDSITMQHRFSHF